MNKITLSFDTCSPSPPGGYNVLWRVAGSGSSYNNAGNFFISPAVFYDPDNFAGTSYEGFIRSISGDLVCNNIPFGAGGGGEPGGYSIALIGSCLGIESSYLVSGGTLGDIVTVRAEFSGILQKNVNNFTMACLAFTTPDGTEDVQICSTCYTDTAIHGFTLIRDVVITMPGTTATCIMSARIQNGSTSPTGVSVTIIDVNGTPENISTPGCRGNEGVGGTC